MRKTPTLFICSSTQALGIAEAIQANLSPQIYAQVWTQGAFSLSRSFLDSLMRASKRFDYVAIVLTAHETGNPGANAQVKDNIAFEMGFFFGAFGLDRTFFVVENAVNFTLPSYIDGIATALFSPPKDNSEDLQALLGPACFKIKQAISLGAETPPAQENPLIAKLAFEAITLACYAIAGPFTPEEAKLRAFIFRKEDNRLTCIHYWAPYNISETIGTFFEITPDTKKQVAVVIAAERKKPCGISIKMLPDEINGVHGNIEKDLCYILAVPIIGKNGEVWGTVDFDASNWRGENILRRETSEAVAMQLGRNIYKIFSGIPM